MQKLRQDVDTKYTWDLSPIFENIEAFEQEFKAVEEAYPVLARQKDSFLQNGTQLFEFLQARDTLLNRLIKLYQYAHLSYDQDLSNNENGALMNRISQLYARMAAEFSFVDTSLASLSEEKLQSLLKEDEKLNHYLQAFDDLRRGQKHILSEAEERLLAKFSPVLDAVTRSFSILNNSDLPFPMVKNEQGEDVQLSHANYGKLLESNDRSVREGAYLAVRDLYKKFNNTFASFLSTEVNFHNINAEVRKFESARAAALFSNAIPESVYDNLVKTVRGKLPSLHRYMSLRKEFAGLEDMRFYDLYMPLIKELKLEYTVEEAKDILLKALAPLGEDYGRRLQQAFDERWIDFVENKGKRSGAYSSGCKGTKPYILITWQGTLDNLYTLAHELGHSLHSQLTWENQDYIYAHYSIFLAEIASTLNENLLTHYLLQEAKSKDFRLAILNHYIDGVKGTVFRQTQFAEFEHSIHQKDQAGEPLTAEVLSKTYYEIEKAYYGDALNLEEESGAIFARIPHFYYNFYVYQYATGFSAATAFTKSILEEGAPAVERYLAFLKAGCSDYPIEVLKKAGLDMTTPAPIEACLEMFDAYVNQFEQESRSEA